MESNISGWNPNDILMWALPEIVSQNQDHLAAVTGLWFTEVILLPSVDVPDKAGLGTSSSATLLAGM